jgi:hypothetical protein
MTRLNRIAIEYFQPVRRIFCRTLMCLARITINTVPKVIHRANQLREQYEGLDEPAGDGVNQFTNLSPTVGVKSIRRGSGGVPGQTKILGVGP